MGEKILLTFESVHQTMKAETVLKDQGLKNKTIPTPREITASCGLSIMMDREDLDKVQTMLVEKLFPVSQVWSYTMGDKKNTKLIDLQGVEN